MGEQFGPPDRLASSSAVLLKLTVKFRVAFFVLTLNHLRGMNLELLRKTLITICCSNAAQMAGPLGACLTLGQSAMRLMGLACGAETHRNHYGRPAAQNPA